MATITVRFWAAARTAAGTDEELVDAPDCSVALDRAVAGRGADRAVELARVLRSSSFLVDGVRRDRAQLAALTGPAVVEVLPPFAGG